MGYSIVTIEREYASGGRDVGKVAAEMLGIPYYGHEILEIAAKRNHTSPEYLQNLEEGVTNSFLYSLIMMNSIQSGTDIGLSDTDKLHLAESEVIADLAKQGPCLIVGRCAGCVLADRKDVLRVFIHADREARKERAVHIYGVDPKKVDNVLKQYDKRRSNYYMANSGKRWDDPDEYHLILDSGKLSIRACAEIIVQAYKGQ